MKEDKIIVAFAEDKRSQCQDSYMITNTGFLDIRQQSLCGNIAKYADEAKGFFYGGFEDAERRILVFVPDYIEIKNSAEVCKYFLEHSEDNPLTLIRAVHKGYKELSHRDYLGSLMGMGLKRDVIGDILVYKGGADIIILKEMTDFLLMNYGKAGRVELSLSAEELSGLIIPEGRTEEKSCTVASLRLDNVAAAVFGISRSMAAEAVRSGLMFVNGVQADKVEKAVEKGDKLVIRGRGKVFLKEIGGTTKKDRIFITVAVMK